MAGESETRTGESPALTPIDWEAAARSRSRARRRRVWTALGIAAVLVAGGVTAGVLLSDRQSPSGAYEARVPASFGHYRLAKKDETLWPAGERREVGRGPLDARVSYVPEEGGGDPYLVSVVLAEKGDDLAEAAGETDILSTLLGVEVRPEEARTFPAGRNGGLLRCARITVAFEPVTRCGWTSSHAAALIQPVTPVGHRPTPAAAAEGARAFLDAFEVYDTGDHHRVTSR
ncbi:hypothetical protein [Streptomyces sp. NPDC088674]|uniref:hypothetical protein n=1 Tax=Streptomyces sp. NPDC088674 TaxID=3365869 RepID=UPI003820429E